MTQNTETRKALLVVDVQNDFCPGGTLAVKNGDKVVEPLNRLIELADKNNWRLYFSKDWHPEDTKHFKDFGGLWPTHCVKNTLGAKFHPDLKIPERAFMITKGTGNNDDGYSPFEGRCEIYQYWPLSLVTLLHGTDELYIGGLATDYCVKAAVLDALKLDSLKRVYLLTNAVRAVNLRPGDDVDAINQMINADVDNKLRFITTDEVVRGLG